jgi:predicted dehydrogenase
MSEKNANSINRRTFVKKASGLAATSFVAPQLLQAKAHYDGADVIKVGLIGCGGRGAGAAFQALSTEQNIQLVAMGDAFRDRLDGTYDYIKSELENNELDASRLNVAEENKFVGFDAYEKVIPLVDVVILTTPPGFRPMHFEAAIKANKHVFMEKPVATDVPGIRKVLAVAEEAKKKKLNVVVGLQRHYEKQYQVWVDMLHGGVIGDIVTSRVYWNSGGVWVRERKPGMTEMEYQMRNWYYFNWLCGDHICEQHIHNLDVGNWVKQAHPVKAQGIGGRLVRTGKDHGEIFDHHIVEYTYADGSKMMSQCRHMPGCYNQVTEAFHGTSGTAPHPGKILSKSGYAILDRNARKDKNPYQVEHDVLFKAIANGEYKFADAENGAKATMTAILGRMATYSGQEIKWDDAMKSNLSLMPERFAWDANPPIMPNADGYYPVAVPGVTKVM